MVPVMVCASKTELKTKAKNKEKTANRNRKNRMDCPLSRAEWGSSFERVCGDKCIELWRKVNTRWITRNTNRCELPSGQLNRHA
jgi:hypothetical protein